MPLALALGALSLSTLQQPPHLDVLMLTGFVLAIAQIACFAHRRTSRDLAVGLCLTALALSIYAVLAGAWPLAMMQLAIAASSAMRLTRRLRSVRRRNARRTYARRYAPPATSTVTSAHPSRIHRFFGETGSLN